MRSCVAQPLDDLPELPEVTDADVELLKRRRRLDAFWRASPYHLQPPKPRAGTGDVERYSDRYSKTQARAPLHQHMTITARYFPVALHGPVRRGARGDATPTAEEKRAAWKGHEGANGGGQDLVRLEQRLKRLQERETKDAATAAAGGGAAREGEKGEKGGEGDQAGEFEDGSEEDAYEDEYDDDDKYGGYDDDEEYDAQFGDDEGAEAVY